MNVVDLRREFTSSYLLSGSPVPGIAQLLDCSSSLISLLSAIRFFCKASFKFSLIKKTNQLGFFFSFLYTFPLQGYLAGLIHSFISS